MNEWLTVGLFVINVLLGIVLALCGFIMKGLGRSVDSMRTALDGLTRELYKEYLPRSEFDAHVRENDHVIRNLATRKP